MLRQLTHTAVSHRPLLGLAAVALLVLSAAGVRAEPATADEPATLGEQLQAITDGFANRAPESMRKAFSQGVADVKATGILDSALGVGDKAPDAELTAPDGSKVAFRSLWADGPLVVTFYRGGWCPYCNLQLRALDQSLTQFTGAGAKLVAITPELPENVKQTAQKNELSLRVLSDPGNKLARELGIAFRLPDSIMPIYKRMIDFNKYNGDDSFELPLAATYIFDSKGVIQYAFLDADYKKRAEPADVVAAVKKIVGE